ncbi:zf-CCHC domain-containing protein [Gossypium australe]|uniref:Zf-CCHC domain-containing protein n=1 Tax=Gossypium australe TaxID=47621 RepID=A0A5B6VV83_9ROSI|nr:zf-CCHC domain-containing protein [Gossypium australe]
MKLNERVKEAKIEKKKVGVTLKSTTNKNSESSEEMDEDKEMTMFIRRFKKFMRSNREKDPIIRYECKKLGHIKFNCPQWKKNGSRKQKLNAHVATWSDEDPSNDDDQEVVNIFLMAIDDTKVSSNLSNSISYSFDELQDAYDELGLEFEIMVLKHQKNISKLKDENSSLSKTNHELESKIHDM